MHIKLSIGKETLDRYLSSIVRDELYDVPLVDLPGLPPLGKKPNAQSFPRKKNLTSSKKSELQPFIHSGFINAGNTCYLNSLCQAFPILPPFWSYTPEEHGHISPILKSFVLNLSLCRRNTAPVDLSVSLRVFGEQLRHRDQPIDINAQQDVPEILEILLEELVNSSNLSQSQLATCLHYEYVCSCSNSSSSEESMMVLPVPVVDHISKCIDKLLLTQTLSDENRWFCNVCNAKQDSTLFVEVKKVPNILILHLKASSTMVVTFFGTIQF